MFGYGPLSFVLVPRKGSLSCVRSNLVSTEYVHVTFTSRSEDRWVVMDFEGAWMGNLDLKNKYASKFNISEKITLS